ASLLAKEHLPRDILEVRPGLLVCQEIDVIPAVPFRRTPKLAHSWLHGGHVLTRSRYVFVCLAIHYSSDTREIRLAPKANEPDAGKSPRVYDLCYAFACSSAACSTLSMKSRVRSVSASPASSRLPPTSS